MNVLALPGSLRAASISAALCRAAPRLAPAELHITVSRDLGSLPLFNPDLEAVPPRAEARFRAAIGGAGSLLVASPEYAHGISGVTKNALDWLVSYEGFVGKPVAVINSSPRARHTHESLLEVLNNFPTLVHLGPRASPRQFAPAAPVARGRWALNSPSDGREET